MPFKTYCYRSIETLLTRSGWEQVCEKWRDWNIVLGLLTDVHDWKIWKTFRYHDGNLYFLEKQNYGGMLNFGWFQPFKHLSNFSIGEIYLVLLNLPRHLRFLRENVVLVGIIPDMSKEPSTNTFLESLVEELEVTWNDEFMLKSLLIQRKECFHIALICVGCDTPASRKLCGFLDMSVLYIYKMILTNQGLGNC